MITSGLLSSDATLNNFTNITQIDYVPGENLDVSFRLFQAERGHRFVVTDLAAIVTVDLDIKSSTLPLIVTATAIDALDRSMWRFSLTQAQTLDLGGSNIEITLDALGDGTVIFKTVLRNALLRVSLSGDC